MINDQLEAGIKLVQTYWFKHINRTKIKKNYRKRLHKLIVLLLSQFHHYLF